MSDSEVTTTPTDREATSLVDQWRRCIEQSHTDAQKLLLKAQDCSDPQTWRRQWFDLLESHTELFLRSPAFLEAMRASILSASNANPTWMTTPSSRIPGRDTVTHTGATPHAVVDQFGSVRLLRYHNESVRYAEPILICFALVNRPYVLDLQEQRSVVQVLLEGGFDVYLLDWGTPDAADNQLQLEDYVCRLLRRAVELVCRKAGVSRLNLLGYCMGGTMATMFSAQHPESIRNLILMATPIDFSGDESLLNLWAREEYFDVDRFVDRHGNCPGEFLQYVFQMMKPVQHFAEKYAQLFERLEDAAYIQDFLAMERWSHDCVPVAGETFRQYVKLLYQQNLLFEGKFMLSDRLVRLEKLACPLLLLVAERDHLVAPRSSLALRTKVASQEVSSLSVPTGHVGLAVSRKAHRQLWPKAAEWMAEHSTPVGDQNTAR